MMADPKYSDSRYQDPMYQGIYQDEMNDFKLRWFDASARLREAGLPAAGQLISIVIGQRQRA